MEWPSSNSIPLTDLSKDHLRLSEMHISYLHK
jgi:hypothetical protein